MRLSGLASGMDTDTMVQNLMRVERLKVDRFNQRKQINLWRQERYNDINKQMANFILNSKKNMGLNKVSNTGSIANNSYKNLDYMSMATSSDEKAVGVEVIGKAANGSFTVEADQLAKAASHTTGEITDEDLVGKKSYELKIDGQSIIVEGKNGEDVQVSDIVKAINDYGPLDENGKKENTGISAFYDKNTKRIFIQKEATDKELKDKVDSFNIDIEFEDAGNIQDGLKSEGNLAKARINNVDVYSKNNNISFNGLNLELKEAGKVVNINVETNVNGIIEKIQGLIEEYNSLLDTIGGLVGEKRYSSYHPLSAEEKKEMTDDDIKLWEEKAKSGMLSNDETLNKTLQNIRIEMFKNVEGLEGKFKNITEIGISTEKYSKGAVGGKLQIDEKKLRAAINEDPEGVMELLFAEEKKDAEIPRESGGVGKTNKGIFTGVYDGLIEGMKSIVDKSGIGENSDLLRNVKSNILIDFVTKRGSISDIDKNVSDLENRIANMEILLSKKEEAYYSKFTAMEKYMYEMNSQSQWIYQQMM